MTVSNFAIDVDDGQHVVVGRPSTRLLAAFEANNDDYVAIMSIAIVHICSLFLLLLLVTMAAMTLTMMLLVALTNVSYTANELTIHRIVLSGNTKATSKAKIG